VAHHGRYGETEFALLLPCRKVRATHAAVGYYAACAISRINPDEGMKPIIGYMVALLIGTLIVAAVPWISTGFP
jgi:hypothetical protein